MLNENEKITISLLCDLYGNLLTQKQLDILRLSNDYDNSLSEIGEQYGISRQAVRDFVAKAEESLLQIEDKLHLLAKITDMKQIANALLDDAINPKQAGKKILEILGE